MKQLSRIVTDFFYVDTWDKNTDEPLDFKPGLDLLAHALLSASAHKIIIPTAKRVRAREIEHIIKTYPPSLAQRIQLVDENGAICKKIFTFLEPVSQQIDFSRRNDRQRRLPILNCWEALSLVANFLYKLAIASKYQAEADVSELQHLDDHLLLLESYVENEEAKFRLEQIHGIYNLYEKPKEIDALAFAPNNKIPIYHRVNDLLDDAKIVELSENRFLLGIPSKVTIAILRIRKNVREILAKKKYINELSAAQQLVRIARPPDHVSVVLDSMRELIGSFQASTYNPPLVNLDLLRYMTVKERLNLGENIGIRFETEDLRVG